jgi:hypothetical protein
MSAQIIDGRAFSERLRTRVAEHVGALGQKHGLTPGLAVVLVGEDPASTVYVRNKGIQTVAAGMNSFEHRDPGRLAFRPSGSASRSLLPWFAQASAKPVSRSTP